MMRRRPIPIAGPWITSKEVRAVADAAKRAWYGDANLYHDKFEKAFAAYVGRKHAIALPSCTSALHLALSALGVRPGDEVVVPEITWIASSAPIDYVGAKPVFADVERDTWCLSADSLAKRITRRTKAVVAVDLYGGIPDMESLKKICSKKRIALIEDAAQAIGSEYHGRNAGSFGVASVFSFHGSKTLTTGEGGMLVTDRPDIYRRCLFLRDHGRAPGKFWNTEVAFKYKMSNVQAALGLAQLERIEELVEKKRRIFAWYRAALEGIPGVTLNHEPPGTRNTYWMVTAIFAASLKVKKETVINFLNSRGVTARPFFYPLSSLPAYGNKLGRKLNPVAYSLAGRGVNLPSALNLKKADVDYVCTLLKQILTKRHTSHE